MIKMSGFNRNLLATAGLIILAAPSFCQELVLAEKLRQLQADKDSFTLIDVRDAGDFQKRHIEGALNLSKDKINPADLPKGGRVTLYCGDARCPLSHAAAKTLIASGMVPAFPNNIYGDLTSQPTLAGQNTRPPSEKVFGQHFIVQHGTTFYDPSYGSTYSNETNFESKAVAGYAVPLSGDSLKVRKPTGAGDIIFSVFEPKYEE